jgi:antitoxin component of RelBE/YafQ-DinJ toxin-antitoxin module
MIKDKNVNIRMSLQIKNEMKKEADTLGLSISNYLIFLHCKNVIKENK